MFRLVGQTEFSYIANNEEQINYIGIKKKPFFAYLTNLSTFAPPIQHYLHLKKIICRISCLSHNLSIQRWLRELCPRLRKVLLNTPVREELR